MKTTLAIAIATLTILVAGIACQRKSTTLPTARAGQGISATTQRAATLAPTENGIVETLAAAPGVLVVVVQTNSNETGEQNVTGPDTIDTAVASWKVNGASPTAVHRYSVPYDERPMLNDRYYPVTTRHRLFLRLPQPMTEGAVYQITGPYGPTSLTFDSHATRCDALKVNQVGYSKRSTLRFANYGVFMGDGGTIVPSSPPAYQVLDRTGAVVASGDGVDMGDDTGTTGTRSGERVYRLSLNRVPEGGPYVVSVPGCGVSRPFGVGDEYTRKAQYVAIRGLYHQRCGIALEQPYTEYTRPTCHTQVADTRTPWVADPVVTVPAGASTFAVKGGYHDAGDFDRRPMHVIIPILMLSYYEGWPSHFTDRQFNIPESGNGIPDFLDEAAWGVLIWEYMQITNASDPQYGGVRQGTEMDHHPPYGRENAATDTGRYGTWAVGVETTAWAAGMFAHEARLIRPYDSARADALLARARLAWAYVARNTDVSAARAVFMYPALQLYLATGEENFHTLFKVSANAFVVRGGNWPEQYLPGNGGAKCQTAHFASYLLNHGRPVDDALVTAMKARVIREALAGGYPNVDVVRSPYPQGARAFFMWGGLSSQGRYADVYAWGSLLTNDAVQRQTFIDAVSALSDYSLGLNPLSMSFYTGLGVDQPQSPLHLDSYFTKQRGLGNVSGILIYGAGDNGGSAYERAVWGKLFPGWDALPPLRRYADGWSFVHGSEFSTHETTVWSATMFGFLAGPVTPPAPPPPPPVFDGGIADASVPPPVVKPDAGVDPTQLICVMPPPVLFQPPVACGVQISAPPDAGVSRAVRWKTH